MINKEQLKADGYAIEYWVNVYTGYFMGFRYSSRQSCDDATNLMFRRPLYRIHVRLK